MKLSIEELCQRHDRWKYEIGESGIWNPLLFLPVEIEIGKKRKTCHAMFKRRWVRGNKRNTITDKIIIYRNVEEFNEVFLDSILVHELIHQYIMQNDIKDTSSHGRIFRHMMGRINAAFPDRLNIRIRDNNPDIPREGEGQHNHILLILKTATHFYCCAIYPGRIPDIEKIVKIRSKNWRLTEYFWATSSDRHFDRFVKCMKAIHGEKRLLPTLDEYMAKYNIRPLLF